VEAVEVWDGFGESGLVLGQLVRVPDGDEADGDARNGQHVENRVQQLGPNPTATSAATISQHRLSHEVDESCDHEDGMKPELCLGIFLPREWPGLAFFAVEHEDPVEDEAERSVQQDLRDRHQKAEATSRSAAHLLLVYFAMPHHYS